LRAKSEHAFEVSVIIRHGDQQTAPKGNNFPVVMQIKTKADARPNASFCVKTCIMEKKMHNFHAAVRKKRAIPRIDASGLADFL
jgi:hypothetical protein